MLRSKDGRGSANSHPRYGLSPVRPPGLQEIRGAVAEDRLSEISRLAATLDAMELAATDVSARAGYLQRALRLEYFTIGWNVLEATVGLVAGVLAGSVALIAFALDSVVEGSSGGVLIWRFRAESRGAKSEDVEKRAVRLVAIAFFALAAYVAVRAVLNLLSANRPEESPSGIALAGVSLVVMPLLARQKRRAARSLDSRALQADSSQTMLCTYLSAVLLVGLVANAAFGWWWADPVAALAISALALKEGHELWTTEDFCCV